MGRASGADSIPGIGRNPHSRFGIKVRLPRARPAQAESSSAFPIMDTEDQGVWHKKGPVAETVTQGAHHRHEAHGEESGRGTMRQ
jgi:hypothetical protein